MSIGVTSLRKSATEKLSEIYNAYVNYYLHLPPVLLVTYVAANEGWEGRLAFGIVLSLALTLKGVYMQFSSRKSGIYTKV